MVETDANTPLLPPLPDRFEAVEPLAASPFERMFGAYDRVLQRRVLLKLPAAGAWGGWSASARERLLREARALAKVRHDGVASIHWVEETAAGPLLVLDLPEGELLADRLAHGTLGVDEAREFGVQLAEALGAVHYQGIVHRGVGPDAVRLLADGRMRLGTFTFAKAFDDRLPSSIDHRRRLESKVAAHLPAYVAPEQLAGRGADPRSDVFALGCLLFRSLCGKDPFAPATEAGALPDPRALRSDLPRDFAEVIRRCTLPVPTARYPTAQAVADALKATRPTATAGAGMRASRLAAAAVVLAVIPLGWWLWPRPVGSARTSGSAPAGPAAGEHGDTYQRCHALLIGIAEEYAKSDGLYEPLHTPVREVQAVKSCLERLGPAWGREGAIDLLCEHEASHAAINAKLEELKRVGSEDAVLVYFAGHGWRQNKRQYWLVAANPKQQDPNIAIEGYIADSRLRAFADACPAKHLLVVLDCCYATSMVDTDAGEPPMRGRVAEEESVGQRSPLLRWPARQTLMAARGLASDGDVLPSFCKAFLAAVDPDGPFGRRHCVDARQVFGHIYDEMSKTGSGQLPRLDPLDGDGSFVFFFPPK